MDAYIFYRGDELVLTDPITSSDIFVSLDFLFSGSIGASM